MEEIILQLLSQQIEAELLRNNLVIYIVPMLNVDGVVIGNYRTNISTHDLNR